MDSISCNDVVSSIFKNKPCVSISPKYIRDECESLCNKLNISQFGDPGRTARDFAGKGYVTKDESGNCTYNPDSLTPDLAAKFLNFKNVYDYIGKEPSNIELPFPHNRIIFGAPGTGKSHQLDLDLKDEKENDYFTYYERVTFHPSYSYANFVGTYKPVKDEKGDGQITYEFVEGPFIRVLRKALCDTEGKNYLLIIEEINRANVTAVFGDVFQLLDRGG